MTRSAAEEVLTFGEGRPEGRRSGRPPVPGELLDVLFREHYAGLLRLGVVMLGDRAAAEDAVQDAFVALHRRWASLRDRDAAEAYLRSAMLNRCRSWVRRQVIQRAPRPLLPLAGSQPSAEESVVVRDDAHSLVTAMRTLPRRQREVLACRYVLELSVAETAETLQISQGTVKVHTSRALKSLHHQMGVTS